MNRSSFFSAACALPSIIALLASTAFGVGPLRMAREARLDLLADASTGELWNGQINSSEGTMSRMEWLPEAEQPRGYSVSFDVVHYGWRSAKIHFVPKRSGNVLLKLMGPFERIDNTQETYCEEIYWANIRCVGAVLPNPTFQNNANHWHSAGARIMSDPEMRRNNVALTWLNGVLSTNLAVTGGQPVIIELEARAAQPDNFEDMARIANRNTPAHIAQTWFARGVAFSDSLELPPNETWRNQCSENDIIQVAAEGFDHIRIQVAFQYYCGPAPDYSLANDIFEKLDPLVTAAIKHKLAVIIDFHGFKPFNSDPYGHKEQFIQIWKQVAQHYQDAPGTVAFELLNEPGQAATTTLMNSFYADAIRVIRQTNPNRVLFLGPGKSNSVRELIDFRLPGNDENLIVTVHSYVPMFFTHQGASFGGPVYSTTGVLFPGPPATPLPVPPQLPATAKQWIENYNTQPGDMNICSQHVVRDEVRRASEWSEHYGRPIHFSEFGVYHTADAASRGRYVRTFRDAFNEFRIGWTLFNWKVGFHYWDIEKNAPIPEMRAALFD